MTPLDVVAGKAKWCVVTGDCAEALASVPRVHHMITDPPYSRRTHEGARSSRRTDLPDVEDFACRTRRRVDLGFDHLDPRTRTAIAQWSRKRVSRWTLTFSDIEGVGWWRIAMEAAGLKYRQTCVWHRLGGAPQFNGLSPAAAVECIVAAHAPGRYCWNGGGKAGYYAAPIVANRLGQRGSRVHNCQKPLSICMELVEDFTDPGEFVVDPFCGSGTTLVACLRLGRPCIGIERDPDAAAIAIERLEAESKGLSLQDARAGQLPLLGGS